MLLATDSEKAEITWQSPMLRQKNNDPTLMKSW
jgi:hypothetical protein